MESRRIVLSGVTRGLGRALLEGFASLGHPVFGCGRNEEAIDQLREQFGPPCDFSVVDIADDEAVRAWAADCRDRFGVPDLLISNAGVINRNASLWNLPATEFDQVVDVNLKGTASLLRHFVPLMIERSQGVIVNFSSTWGRSTSPEVAPYCATKWAIEGLTQALSQELPAGMAAVAFNPGVIDTDMLRSCFGDYAASYPTPRTWASRAVPFLLRLGPTDNGASLTCD